MATKKKSTPKKKHSLITGKLRRNARKSLDEIYNANRALAERHSGLKKEVGGAVFEKYQIDTAQLDLDLKIHALEDVLRKSTFKDFCGDDE